MRLKVLEEGLKPVSNGAPRRTEEVRSSSTTRRPTSGSEEASKLLANGSRRQRSSAVTQLRASMASQTLLRATNGRLTSKSFDGGRSLDAGTSRIKAHTFSNGFEELRTGKRISAAEPNPAPLFTAQPKPEVGSVKPDPAVPKSEAESAKSETGAAKSENGGTKPEAGSATSIEDPVPGVLYDLLQKEVVNLRKASHEKDQSLKDKDDAIEVGSRQTIFISICVDYCLTFLFTIFSVPTFELYVHLIMYINTSAPFYPLTEWCLVFVHSLNLSVIFFISLVDM
jgi:hypothetical protein